jgi:hypothetical protein
MTGYWTNAGYYARRIGGGCGQTEAQLYSARQTRTIEANDYRANNYVPPQLDQQITTWVAYGGPKPWLPAGDGRQVYPPVPAR